MSIAKHKFVVGQRCIIRYAEWSIRKVDHLKDGSFKLTCYGISDFIRGRESIFISSYDAENIIILDPLDVKFVIDNSPNYKKSLLYIESLHKELTPVDNKISIAHKAAIDRLDYQLKPALQALDQLKHRILIADDVGIGKTTEAGILVSELIKRGKGKRILVVAVKSMLTQFQKEFWNKFSIALTRLDSVGIQKIQNKIPRNMNPFFYYDRSIISIDTLKKKEYYNNIDKANWDIIIIDEAHNVADRNITSQKSILAQKLSSQCDSLIMLTATPHDGKPESFASILNMLDPTALTDSSTYKAEDYKNKGLVIRRLKKDLYNELKNFPQAKYFYDICKAVATPIEEAAFVYWDSLKLTGSKNNIGVDLFIFTLVKSLLSSPAACLETIDERLKKSDKDNEDFVKLEQLKSYVQKIDVANFSKYLKLLDMINNTIKWTKKKNDRIVIFTERIATLNFLYDNLLRDLQLTTDEVSVLHGTLSDIEINNVIEAFSQEKNPLRLLIASDIASEGINLHRLSHRLIHFDLTYSYTTYQQRNGRIDRYGQEFAPEIYYLHTVVNNSNIKADLRIFDILIKKDNNATKNIGDIRKIMINDDYSEKMMQDAIINKKTLADVEYAFFAPEEDPLAMFFSSKSTNDDKDMTVKSSSLFASEFNYMSESLNYLKDTIKLNELLIEPTLQQVSFMAPKDLQDRFNYMSPEFYPPDGYFQLCSDRTKIKSDIAESNNNDNKWSKVHYLWELNPVYQWIRDRLLNNIKRQEVPVLILNQLPTNNIYYLISGVISNKKAQPVIHEWICVCFSNKNFIENITYNDFLDKYGLNINTIHNNEHNFSSSVHDLLNEAVTQAKKYMEHKLQKYKLNSQPKFDQALNDLARLEKIKKSTTDNNNKSSNNISAKKNNVDEVISEFFNWINDTKEVSFEPYMQIVAVFTGVEQ